MDSGLDLVVRAVPYDHPDPVALTEQVQRYYEEIYGGRDHDALEPAQFEAPGGAFFVGYADGTAVTMGGWSFTDDVPAAGDAQIRRMYTRLDARRHGYGLRLLAALEADATAHGAMRTVLSTGLRQASAVAMYRAAGYTEIPAFGFYAGKSGVVCLAKGLAPRS